MSAVVVAGASGYLGRFLVAELLARGHRVRALVRRRTLARPDAAPLPAGTEIFPGEATQPETLGGLCDGFDLVISSLGITRQTDRVAFDDVDHLANAHVLSAATRAGVRRFAFVSVVRPELFRGSALVRAREQFVTELHRSRLSSCVVRSTGFFHDLLEILDMARRGRVLLFGDGLARTNPIHGEDLAARCVDALESDDTTLDVGGPEVLSWNQIAELAFHALQAPPRLLHVPTWLAHAALAVMRPFDRRRCELARFMTIALSHDLIAPASGNHRVADLFHAAASRGHAASPTPP